MSSDKESSDEEDRVKFTHPVTFVIRPFVLQNNPDDVQRNPLVVDSHDEDPIVSTESDVSRREEAEGDSSIQEGHSDCQEDIGFNDETSPETIENGDEMHKEVQTKEETKENVQVDVLHEAGKEKMSKKKERTAKKREKLVEVKMHLKKAVAVLEQKLENTIPEDEMKRLCDELTEKLLHTTDVEVKEQQGFIPVSRPPSPDEEPDWMKQLRKEGEPVSQPNCRSLNGDRGDVMKVDRIPRALRKRRVRCFSLPESHYGWGETHIVKQFIGDDMDKYLDTIGFVKRSVPQDGNSLYRAICEELFLCQRQEDIDLVKKWICWIVELDYKIQRIRKGRENVKKDGNKDHLRAAAKLFRARISVYEKPNQMPCVYEPPKGITPEIEILLCEIEPNYFERVIERVTAERLGVSQAVAYRAVIAQMYGLDKETIRHCIHRVRVEMGVAKDPLTLSPFLPTPSPLWIPEYPSYYYSTPIKFRPPVQYCKIKCMDPGIYRNIPCDLYTQEIKQKKTKSEKTSDELPVVNNAMKKDNGIPRQSEIAADCGDRKKVLRNDCVVGLKPAHSMHNGIAKNRKSPPPPKIILKHSTRPQTPPLSPLVAHVIPPFTNPPPSPVSYILEPLTWSTFASPPTSPICMGAPSPGMTPVVSMMQCPVQPPFVRCSVAGQPISVSPAPGTFPSYPFLHSIPPMNPQRRFSVPEQIMANYNRFPLDPSFQTPLSPRYVQTYPNPVPSSSNRYATSPHKNAGIGSDFVQPPFSPASVDSSAGDESTFSPSPSKLALANVPFFSPDQMKEVRKNTTYSANTDGSDLPRDTATLRYYYNLGMSVARHKNGRMNECKKTGVYSSIDVSPSHMVPRPPENCVGSSTVPFVYGAHPIPSRTLPISSPAPSSVMHSVPPPPASPTYVNGTMYYQPQVTAKEEEEYPPRRK